MIAIKRNIAALLCIIFVSSTAIQCEPQNTQELPEARKWAFIERKLLKKRKTKPQFFLRTGKTKPAWDHFSPNRTTKPENSGFDTVPLAIHRGLVLVHLNHGAAFVITATAAGMMRHFGLSTLGADRKVGGFGLFMGAPFVAF